jgi:hypothetical protein
VLEIRQACTEIRRMFLTTVPFCHFIFLDIYNILSVPYVSDSPSIPLRSPAVFFSFPKYTRTLPFLHLRRLHTVARRSRRRATLKFSHGTQCLQLSDGSEALLTRKYPPAVLSLR